MSEEKEHFFMDGLFVKKPREGAPDFVKGSISLRVKEAIEYLQRVKSEWINLDIKEGKSGDWYAEVNLWKPDASKAPEPAPEAAVEPVAKEEDGGDSLPF